MDAPQIRRAAGVLFFAAICLFLTLSGLAQEAVSPESPVSPSEVQALQGASPPAVQSNPGPEVASSGNPVADTPRRFTYALSCSLRGVADDNINISSTNRVSDNFLVIEPDFHFGLGTESGAATSLSFVYRPSLFLFQKTTSNNAVQHIIHLSVAHQFGGLNLSLTEDIQLLDGSNLNSLTDPTGHQANLDLGRQAQQQFYTTSLGYSHDVSTKTFLSGGTTYAVDNYTESSLISSENFYTNLFFNYVYSSKLTVGLGGSGGYNTTSNAGSTDQTFEQVNLRLSYNATAKISLSGGVGVEFRQTGGFSSDPSPVFNLTASYAPFDGTSISLTGRRHTENSAVLAGQNYYDTGFTLSVSQRFFQRVYASLAAGYTNSQYFSTVQGLNANRTDDYYYVQPGIDMDITRFWAVGAYYQYRKDSSSFAAFSFYDNQVGIHTKLTF